MDKQDYIDYVTRLELIMNNTVNEFREVLDDIKDQLNKEQRLGDLEHLLSADYRIFHTAQTLFNQAEDNQKRISEMHLKGDEMHER
ncbi:hypothetical protein ASD24_24440 [Paenibacillus sp. Root52]|uniref:hypothetical protein n=1 Tax=Paenibacillus sp. Root52 TaxID=1736552 RepID=UPI0006FA8422|nr:hypothetical protein [Paenibacillus sp. Root52]KQY90949.1 hypothetical protein ASD24_24440 [Paenibacillus sp. Root52]